MTLREYIAANPGLDDTQIAAARNAKSEIRVNTQRLSTAGVLTALGADESRAILGALRTAAAQDPLIAATLDLLAGQGVDFSHAMIQGQLDAIGAAGVLSSPRVAALKALGRKPVSPHELEHGDGTTCTEAAVASMRAAIAKDAVSAWWAEVTNETVQPLISAGQTVAQIKAALIAEWE